MLLVFALTLFTSANLLMAVQPMIGKLSTPLLGGTPAVWNTCMVFFMTLLLAGYCYAHFTTRWLGVRKQAAVHLAVLALPFLFFPIAVNKDRIVGGLDNPIPQLLLLLAASVGVPFFVVSTSAPLLQKWFSGTSHPAARDPYFLYAASNLGSLLGLLSYPTLIEPSMGVTRAQPLAWSIGYTVLALLIGGCAAYVWLSPAAKPEPQSKSVKEAESAAAPALAVKAADGIQPAGARVGVATACPADCKPRDADKGGDRPQELTGEVTWPRRLRWVLLAAVPSSLMLGATTYMTTDIAAIAFLWVLPLALYLLSFIIVFSKIPPVVQLFIVIATHLAHCAVLAVLFYAVSYLPGPVWVRLALRLGILVSAIAPFYYIAKLRSANMIRVYCIVLLPLSLLLLLFMTFSDVRPAKIAIVIGMHLYVLFVVSMVCHGELARDRPATKHLTEFFLWLSFGGVVGGLFNALVAPIIFDGIVEYQLAMVVACLLLPPLGLTADSRYSTYVDLGLAAACLAAGSVLIGMRLWTRDLSFATPTNTVYLWYAVGLTLMAGLGVCALARRGRQAPRLASWIDLLLPFALLLLTVGLIWGLEARPVLRQVRGLGASVGLDTSQVRSIVVYGIPAVICYTCIERATRFGLCVAAFLLAVAFTTEFDATVLTQERSFFGVLRVETDFESRSLVHGTTLHGRQFLSGPLASQPMTYFHRTGPIGHVLHAYNPPRGDDEPKPNIGIIGLGTGTLACYAQPGQRMTFYDIDPVVRKLAYDKDTAYFTYVEQARRRGAKLDLVMGDARLTLERQHPADDEKYHIFIVDAFSSDSIPIHLITYEAVKLYLERLQPDGILCFHISNRYLDLKPVLANLAEKYTRENRGRGELVGYYMNDGDDETGKAASTWVVLARSADHLKNLKLADNWDARLGLVDKADPDDPAKHWDAARPVLWALGVQAHRLEPSWYPLEARPEVGEWTDDYAPLLRVFSW
jgi:hypothetical protein